MNAKKLRTEPSHASFDAATAEKAIKKRIRDLQIWLKDHGPDCETEQAHLDHPSVERAYWHYGYLASLRDVLSLLNGDTQALQALH